MYPPTLPFQSDLLIDAVKAECDRSAPILQTFSSFTPSYSIMIGEERWRGSRGGKKEGESDEGGQERRRTEGDRVRERKNYRALMAGTSLETETALRPDYLPPTTSSALKPPE